jgi:hypothetical protein
MEGLKNEKTAGFYHRVSQSSYCAAPSGIDPYLTSSYAYAAPPNLTNDYDVVGFDTDQCLVNFKMDQLAKLVCWAFLQELYESEGYPKEVLQFDYDKHLSAKKISKLQ